MFRKYNVKAVREIQEKQIKRIDSLEDMIKKLCKCEELEPGKEKDWCGLTHCFKKCVICNQKIYIGENDYLTLKLKNAEKELMKATGPITIKEGTLKDCDNEETLFVVIHEYTREDDIENESGGQWSYRTVEEAIVKANHERSICKGKPEKDVNILVDWKVGGDDNEEHS